MKMQKTVSWALSISSVMTLALACSSTNTEATQESAAAVVAGSSATVCRCSCQLARGGGGGTFNICTDGACQSPGWDKDITDPAACAKRAGTECQGSSAYLGTDTTHCSTASMFTTGTLTNCKVIEKGSN